MLYLMTQKPHLQRSMARAGQTTTSHLKKRGIYTLVDREKRSFKERTCRGPDFFQWNKRYSAWGMPLSSWSLSHLAPPFLKPSQLHMCHWQMDLRWQAQNCDQSVGPERCWCWVQRLSSKLGSCDLDEIGKHRCLTMPAVLFPWRSLQGGKARAVSLWSSLMNKWSLQYWDWPY